MLGTFLSLQVVLIRLMGFACGIATAGPEAARAALARLRIDSFAQADCTGLSGGQRQLV